MDMSGSESYLRLFRVISSLESEEECRNFFEDICTIKEIQDMAQRLETALLLDRGMSYQHISETVGVSTATISRVNRCLRYGSGGYRAVIESLKRADAAGKCAMCAEPDSDTENEGSRM